MLFKTRFLRYFLLNSLCNVSKFQRLSHRFLYLFLLHYLFTIASQTRNSQRLRSCELCYKRYTMFTQSLHKTRDPELSGLEKEILISMQKGLSSQEIALLFNCTNIMISKHRQSILKKTKCSSMFDVISLADKYGWI